MIELICTAFLLLTSSACSTARVQETNGLDEESLSAAIESERQRQEAVGVAVGIVRDGELVWQGHFGFEDRENKVPVTKDTMFRWASISKPLTAIVAAQLAIAGALDLDADLRTHVPEFPEHTTAITTRQLLGHLGGIVHYRNGPVVRTKRVYDSPHPFTDVVLALDKFKESPLIDEPGNGFHYSTHGFILASAVVQRAGDAPFRDQVDERIATTLKLDTLQPDDQFREIPHRAIGYARRAGRIIPSTNNDVAWKLGGGGFISTIGDLARFAAGLCNEDFMTDELKAILFSEQRTSSGKPTGYGLGFGVSRKIRAPLADAELRVTHSGSQEKVRSLLVVYPDRGDGIVIFTNSEYAKPSGFLDAINSIEVFTEKPKSP